MATNIRIKKKSSYLRAKYYLYYFLMIIDLAIITLVCIAMICGWRKGAFVQLLQLIGLYIAILLAPEFANLVGGIFTDDPGLAYLSGFIVIILGVWIITWVIAPLCRKILFFKSLKQLDSMIGLVFTLLTSIIVLAVLSSIFLTANIGNLRVDKVLELGSSGLTPEQIEEYTALLESRDESLRDYFEPKYVDYETLDESKLFYMLAAFGDTICPGLEDVQGEIMEWTLTMKSTYESVNR